jgi:hypothetical protein
MIKVSAFDKPILENNKSEAEYWRFSKKLGVKGRAVS